MRWVQWLIEIIFILVAYRVLRTVFFSLVAVYSEKVKPYEQHIENPTLRILFVGDSMALGTGASKSENSLVGNFGKVYPDAHITNISFDAITTAKLYQKVKGENLGNYDIAVIIVGGMDIIKLTRLRKIRRNLLSLIELLQTHSKKIILFRPTHVGSLPAFGYPHGLVYDLRTDRVSKLFEEIAKEKDVVVFEHIDMLFNDKKKHFFKDGIHPNDVGYKIWFDRTISNV